MNTRREFLGNAAWLAAARSVEELHPALVSPVSKPAPVLPTERISLDGAWQFRLDPHETGEIENWAKPNISSEGWREVMVPHTWQIWADAAGYYGTAWYRRRFDAPKPWARKALRIEFEAVFHSAKVWVNGVEAGEHLRRGYTAFAFEVASLVDFGAPNELVVKVNNAYDDHMLPRGRSFDWANDGGIYRPVNLLVTPQVYIERADVYAIPDFARASADLEITVYVRSDSRAAFEGELSLEVLNQQTGLVATEAPVGRGVEVQAGNARSVRLKARIQHADFWHFDHPALYWLVVNLNGSLSSHQFRTAFGVRSLEVRDGSFHLNGERVRLMGVERMAGSHPEFGMAEPSWWIEHDHDALKQLNCVFTRVHWPQDQRVLDYCDQHGILVQLEVPAWGADTFQGMGEEPAPEIVENGLAQLREMIGRDRNHPCIFSWGLANEINGQSPAAYKFARRMLEEAKNLDPGRLCSYASNSLQKKPGADVSGLMDFIEWNEYYESWYRGTPEDLAENLAEIHQAFPGKPIVISEYGYCACTPERPEGDRRRIEILRAHTAVCREKEYVGGLIFFCYNDYRTHIGDQGRGVMKQRIHGVVDVLGAHKASYGVLRDESSPIESLEYHGNPGAFVVDIRTRSSVPAYPLRNYAIRGTLYGYSDIPLERREAQIPVSSPGERISIPFEFEEKNPVRVEFDVVRPTGFSAFTRVWRP